MSEKEIREMPLYMDENEALNAVGRNLPLEAIQAMLEEGSAEERASNFKNHGNECFALGSPQCMRDAISFYSRGLAEKSSDLSLNSTLLLNRSAAHLFLENWKAAQDDAAESLRIGEGIMSESSKIKAYLRLGRAALRRCDLSNARSSLNQLIRLSQQDLNGKSKSVSLLSDSNQMDLGLKKDCLDNADKSTDSNHNGQSSSLLLPPNILELEKAVIAAEAVEKRRIEREMKKEAALKETRSIISDLENISVVEGVERSILALFDGAEMSIEDLPRVHLSNPTYDYDGKLSGNYIPIRLWPIIFLYPEAGQSDTLAEVAENCSFHSLIKRVFEESPAWDPNQNFKKSISQSKTALYRVINENVLLQIDLFKSTTATLLKDFLQSGYIESIERGILAFHLFSNSNSPDCIAFRDRFATILHL